MILYIHVHSCLWFIVASYSQLWVPPYTSLSLGPAPDGPLFYSGSHSYQYSYSLYHGVLMLAGNDIYPQTENEAVFITISLVVGAIINANIFGNMAVLIANINK